MAVVNFILTVIGAFAFGYKAMEYSLHQPNVTAVSWIISYGEPCFLLYFNWKRELELSKQLAVKFFVILIIGCEAF